ncbi:Uu.00g117400.m01.CDS01 [Anthostomella pinea]|uniref:Uu.00g117400.m01.CDS01 n=1 Tax=Anthostomella pinea TaxID=933095 RepID=A0AAI8VGX9_9PEZI|nr:Uu.00g117400.m01.CDS01 [Anthostomella pinea]
MASKDGIQRVEDAEANSKISDGEKGHSDSTSSLSSGHKEYILARHGTLELEPMPDMDDADPLNWSSWKKVINLLLVVFHAMMATFTAAAIQSSFALIAEDLDVPIQSASYLTSEVIVVLGVAPLLWRPISHRYGRRPILLVSLLLSIVGNIGCAKSPTYAAMAACRAITAFFICPASAIGSGVVTEMFFRQERARWMGVWTVMVTLGIPLAPFIFGFVVLRVDYRWVYWILAITNGVQLLLYFFLGDETRYIRNGEVRGGKAGPKSLLRFSRIDPTPLSLRDFTRPLELALRPSVVIPAAAYAMIFLWQVMISIEIPQVFAIQFHLNTQQVGLQYLALIIGSLIGEVIGGTLSDRWMLLKQRRTGSVPRPEYRLWLSYFGFALGICGTVVFLVQLGNAGETWNITPLIGAAIQAAGNQIVTTVLITYAVDRNQSDSASVGVFITLVRQVWGFIGPFWFTDMILNTGYGASAGIATAMMVGVSVVPTVLLQWRGAGQK